MRIGTERRKNREQLKHARVAVLGAARSGVAVARLLAESGAAVLLSDTRPESELNLPLADLRQLSVEVESGGHSEAVLQADLICISPGIPLSIPILQKAQERNITITGEIEVASWFCRSEIAAITGSNGKTTTTTLAGEILCAKYSDTIVAGNIGKPFAELVQHSSESGVAVLELSSFQLETIYSFRPRIAVLMNLTANHLDRYPDFEAYAAAKLNILKNMRADDLLIYNSDDEVLNRRLEDSLPRKLRFSLAPHAGEGAYWEDDAIVLRQNGEEKRIHLQDYRLRGPHNRYN
ncbi:MAG: UDP-N-acetylmuramoyl-L-alanine--D-glutamate ligase, partial [Calditrichia bacterium]